MSIEVMTTIYKSGLGKSEKAIALAYADHAHDDGTHIFPSVDYTAWKTGYSRRSVQTITNRLVEVGVLVPDGVGPNGTNKYRFDFQMLPKREPYKGGAKSAPRAIDDIGGVQNLQGGVQLTTSGGAGAAPKTSYNHQLNHKSKTYIYADHAENAPPQEVLDALTDLRQVSKTRFDVLAPPDDIERFAYEIAGNDILGFGDWWKKPEHGHYAGKPAIKSVMNEWDNYNEGVDMNATANESDGYKTQAPGYHISGSI